MKTPWLFSRGDRLPEKGEVYFNPDEVETFARKSRKGLMGLVETLFVRRILKTLPARTHITMLDVGTGPAWILTRLAKARPQWSVFGLDASPLMLKMARGNADWAGVKIQFLHGGAGEIPLPDASVDVVTSHFSFSEFSDGRAAIREMERVLKPGGLLVIQDLERPPHWKRALLLAWMYATDPTSRLNHQYNESLRGAYTADELRQLLASAPSLRARVARVNPWIGGHLRVWAIKEAARERAREKSVVETK